MHVIFGSPAHKAVSAARSLAIMQCDGYDFASSSHALFCSCPIIIAGAHDVMASMLAGMGGMAGLQQVGVMAAAGM